MFLHGLFYLISAILFIMALRGLSSPVTARRGNFFGIAAMVLVVLNTLTLPYINNYLEVLITVVIGGLIGLFITYRINMKQLPQLIAGFHSLVGLAAVCISISTFYNPTAFNIGRFLNIETRSIVELSIGAAIGAITFTGSLIAFAKLQGLIGGSPVVFKGQHILNLLLVFVVIGLIVYLCINNNLMSFWLIIGLSLLLGFLLIIPVGGADMPVIVSMLNSYSGWATAGIGFTLANPVLVIVGAIVGSSGAILSYIMCKGMNRSIINVLLGGALNDKSAQSSGKDKEAVSKNYKTGSVDDAAFLMKNASSVIIVPGYGMAVSQAQHSLKEMVEQLKANGTSVKFAIHPVAGRMPGHMNVLLAEANIDYEDVFEMEQINNDFSNTDVVYVIGANDVTNPSAKTDKSSPIYGMPILEVEKAKTILFVKRTMGTGYSGVDNDLFYNDKTWMLLGDAKKVTEEINISLTKM